MHSGQFVVGIDLGGTKIKAGVADLQGRLLGQARAETRAQEGAGAAFGRIARAVEEAAAAAGVEPRRAAAMGIGSPGPLDLKRGLVVDAANLGWVNYPLRDNLADRFGVPVVLDNDCKAGGLGEFRFGAGRGARHMLYYGVGTGIGGAVILDGRLWYGATGNAAELGHTIVDFDGPMCTCGARGCVEALAAGIGLTHRGRDAAREGRSPMLLELANGDLQAIDGGTVAQAARAGDPAAQAIWERGLWALGAALATGVNAFSPQVVVLGGGVVGKNGAEYVAAVAAHAARLALAANWAAVQVRQAELGEDSVLVGAVALALDLAASRSGEGN